MTAEIINGKEIIGVKREQIKNEIDQLKQRGIQPGLAVILVGEDPASQIYVRNKERACEQVGIYSEVYRLPTETKQSELLAQINQLNRDPKIHGILVQSPVPDHISESEVIDAINPKKDVDCFHPINVGNLVAGKPGPLPCTPAGVIEILKYINYPISGKQAVVIGRSNIVGKPMSMLLLRENATVTICHSKTENMREVVKQADIVVAAVGRAKLVTKEDVKPGAVVIDVGMNRLENGKLCGDVDFEEVKEVAGAITPVPGTVGPMTITMLLQNTLEAAKVLHTD